MRSVDSNLSLNGWAFDRIRKIVFDTTGIVLSDNKSALIIARLSKRLINMGISDFNDYVSLLERDSLEVLDMINRITTNLTYFYREAEQFELLRNMVLPEQINKSKKKQIFRVWSTACSTGAEVYTILFEIFEFFDDSIPDNIELKILGSDIDTNVLAKAKKGAYNKEELNTLDDNKVEKYFNRKNEDLYTIKEEFKKYVGFRKINLVYDDFVFKGEIDIIFCRNVAIYFDEQTKDKMYNKFYNVLSENGYVFSGQSENLFKWSDKFKFVKKSIYKRIS